MKKHESIVYLNYFCWFSKQFFLGPLRDFFLILKNGPFKQSAHWKVDFVIQFVIVGRDKFYMYLRYSKLMIFRFFLLS